MQLFNFINKYQIKYSKNQINSSFVYAFLLQNNVNSNNLNLTLQLFIEEKENFLVDDILNSIKLDIKIIEKLFELNLNYTQKKEHGVVFTPKYITEYIVKETLKTYKHGNLIIDFSCGCGAFMITTCEYLMDKHNLTAVEILSNYLFGIDISIENINYSKIILMLYVLSKGETINNLKLNLLVADSLTVDWGKAFNTDKFDYIIGNPPYVNTHNMSQETLKYLKQNFETTKKGNFNIYYAFIEKSVQNLSCKGEIGLIIPNNYLTISSAELLREYLKKNNLVDKIIDFRENMIFHPVRTYNSILFLNKHKNQNFSYSVLSKSNDIKLNLFNANFNTMSIKSLNKSAWKLLSEIDLQNINKIETAGERIKDFIRVGIATLKDTVYIIDGFDNEKKLFFKKINNIIFYIEPEIIVPLYKISNNKDEQSLQNTKRYIIFPYISETENSYYPINENILLEKFPLTHKYFSSQKEVLYSRDKGKKKIDPWYAYGRTQGLSLRGKKLLFPTFSYLPKFMLEESNDALFCNGYAIFESETVDIILLQKIVNSKIMDYYISSTSYSIEGGYKCYQKKYIQNFSIPSFNDEEKNLLLNMTNSRLDEFLINKYKISI